MRGREREKEARRTNVKEKGKCSLSHTHIPKRFLLRRELLYTAAAVASASSSSNDNYNEGAALQAWDLLLDGRQVAGHSVEATFVSVVDADQQQGGEKIDAYTRTDSI